MSDAKVDAITIRMYNTGSVGDCLLLLFEKNKAITFRMLIDCGGFNTKASFIEPCVEDIKKTCGKLDLLVVTHQHEDHISGFNLARSMFNSIPVDKVWMSWVEDKKDDVAEILKKKYGKKLKELKKATQHAVSEMKRLAPGNTKVKGIQKTFSARKKNLDLALALLEFEEGRIHGKNLGKGSRTNDDAMEYVRKKGKTIHYKHPGQVVDDLVGAEGVKFYILGPPRDEQLKYLKIEMNESEMYHFAATDNSQDDAAQTETFFQSGITLKDKVSPFGKEFELTGNEKKEFFKKYKSTDYRWRQIETDWLESGNEMALALTKLTNNTSLAMALEFGTSEKVILLPADAQSGNWMSWHKPETSKSLKDKGGKSTKELLANTVFYKVGHHLSHNGTASLSGLELMDGHNLIAFAPLIQDKIPAVWGGAKNFPAKELYKVVIKKTKGRLVRTDVGLVNDNNAEALRSNLSAVEKKELKDCLRKGPCYYEFKVRD